LFHNSHYKWYFYPPDADTTSEPSDSVAAYQTIWKWDNSQFSSDYMQFVVLASWRSHITLRKDTLVCYDTSRHHVRIANNYLQFPSAVTPNGDGINDTWLIVNLAELGYYPINRLHIYDRWGKLVYKRDNISTLDDAWNPNQCDCPYGTYFFRFDAQGPYGFVQRNGAIEVIR
jgi:gliding motility-associated-like protein